MQKLKILLIIPNLGKGGAQQIFWNQFHLLSERFEVRGCVFNWDGAFASDKLLQITSLEVSAGETVFQKLWCFFKRVVRLRKLKKEWCADISVSHLEGADYINVLSQGTGKTVCWIHGTKKFDANIEGFIGWIRKRIFMPLLYVRADKVVTVSKGIREEITSSFRLSESTVETIYNGLDIAKILNQMKLESTFDSFFKGKKILITHCRLARQKNLKFLIEIYRELVNRKQALKLVLIGDGELRQELIDYCKTLGLRVFTVWNEPNPLEDHQVFFLGYQRNPYQFLKFGSLFVMSSNWEGFPLALCEAIACGLPVVSADCYTGPREIIAPSLSISDPPVNKPFEESLGLLMPPAIPQSLGVWINEVDGLLNADEKMTRFAIGGRRQVELFSLDRCNAATIDLLTKLSFSPNAHMDDKTKNSHR